MPAKVLWLKEIERVRLQNVESIIQSLQVAKRKEKQRTTYIYTEFVLCIQPTHVTVH